MGPQAELELAFLGIVGEPIDQDLKHVSLERSAGDL